MGKLYSIITALLMAVSSAVASVPAGYEWWFDNDVSSAQTGKVTGEQFDIPIDLSGLPNGAHYFNCRLHTEDGVWGSVYRKMFFSVDNEVGAVAYEYWFDDDYATKKAGNISTGSLSFEVDPANLNPGAHFFNCRLYTNYGGWGSVYRQMVFLTGTNSDIVAYEYWLDDNYGSKVSGEIAAGENAYTVALTGLRKGLHRFNYRLRNGAGMWGSVFSEYFFYTTYSNTPFTDYEYWLDSDYANHKSGKATTNPVNFEVDLTGFDRSGEFHYFNMRVRDGDGEWSSFYRKVIIFYDDERQAPLIGYRHSMNGKDLGYVKLDTPVDSTHTFMVDVPDDLGFSVRDKRLLFDGDNVSVEGGDSIHYRLQIQTELGWAPPTEYDMEVSHSFSTTAVEMGVNTSQTFDTPASGEFVAVRFSSIGKPLYFRSDSPIALDIYKDGERVMEIDAKEVASMAAVELGEGEYFGILRDTENPGASQFTLHLMDTPNTVPLPEIVFENGMVTITCSREDANIYYTLDDSQPTSESNLYEAPFALDRNAVVKAVAIVPGSDINPSGIAELVVDSYKVTDPEIRFENLMLVITSDQREGVHTHYTLDGTEPTQESAEYGAPISLSGNVNVMARSFKEGYNPSGIVEFAYTHSVYVTQSPEISVDGTTVTLTAVTEGSTLYYGIDNPDPEAMTLYESPFEMTGNGTIYAQARKNGMYDSEVVSVEINGRKMPKPQISCSDNMVKITCANADAEIHYTLDGSAPTSASTLYEGEFEFDRNGVIKALAVDPAGNLDDSDIAELVIEGNKVASPEISVDGTTVTLTAVTEGSTLYYGIDNPDPAAMTMYESPFEMESNGIIYAQARKEGMTDSDVVSYEVSNRKTAIPHGEFDMETKLLTLLCDTEGAVISYTENPDGNWTEYTEPIHIEGNVTIYAKAIAPKYLESDVAEIVVSEYKCMGVTVGYNGRYLTLTTEEADAEIRYTLDGSNPAEGSTYTGTFDAGGLKTVKAIAVKEGYMNSDIAEYSIQAYGDEEHAETAVGGVLRDCYEWGGNDILDSMETLRVEGSLNGDDYALLRTMGSLRHLDIEKTETTTVPDSVFAGTRLVTVSMPQKLTGYGNGIFSHNPDLCAIVWNSADVAVTPALTEDVENPNLLLYLKTGAPDVSHESGVANTIDRGKAASITLVDRCPFHAPEEFDADEIAYTRTFTKETEIGGCAGWETLTLPFDVQTVRDSRSEVKPFGVSSESERRYWLYAPTATGWEKRTEIKGYEPYITAMPNNPLYIDEVVIKGDVVFTASGVKVAATPEPAGFAYRNGDSMWPNYSLLAGDGNLWTVNDEWHDGNAPGSVFAKGLRDVRPFECYLTSDSSRRYLPIFDSSDVEEIMSETGMRIWSENGEICILSGISRRIYIHDTVGQLVRIAEVTAGEVCRVRDIAPGVYLVGDYKIMVK